MSLNYPVLLFPLTCLLASAGASADVLYQQLPDAPGSSQQSDASTGTPWLQSMPTLTGATLDKISWWGYHGQNSLGAAFDSFEVLLGGVAVSGSLTSTFDSGAMLYTLDVADVALTASTLEIWNNSLDVEWFWSGSNGTDLTAFRLEGTRSSNTVPEPALLGLLGVGGIALWASRRKNI